MASSATWSCRRRSGHHGSEPLNREGEAVRRLLEETFRRVQGERMHDLPLLNPVLNVEAIGFRRSVGARIGVLITPWTMSLLRLPDDDPVPVGHVAARELPRGPVDFVGAVEEGIGPYETCSLFSPMHRFESQETARAVAFETLSLLLRPGPDLRPQDPQRRGGGPLAAVRRNAGHEYDRRSVLRGAFLSDDGDSP